MKLISGFKKWLAGAPADSRQAARFTEPAILVHYWDGSAPEGRTIRDISNTGAYIVTKEHWYPGTIVRLILRGYHTSLTGDTESLPYQTTTISSRVIRQDPDGVAVQFLFPTSAEEQGLRAFLATIPKVAGPSTISRVTVEPT
ncbi:MAG: PilZ domain-containing protein [Bryobacteraceae bacterium]